MGASTWGWCVTGQQRLPGRLYGFCARRCNRERCRIRSGPGCLEQLLLSGTGELRDGPSGAWMAVLQLLLAGAGEPWNRPSATWLAVLGLLLSSAGEAQDGPHASWLAVPKVLLSALGAGTRLVPQLLPGRLYGFCAQRCNRERCGIRSGPGCLERLLLLSARVPQDSPDAAWLVELELLLLGARAPRRSPSVICQAVLELLPALGAGTRLVPR